MTTLPGPLNYRSAGDPSWALASTKKEKQTMSENGRTRNPEDTELTLDDLRKSNHAALKRIAARAAQNMSSSAYTSHNSHHSAHNNDD